MFLAKFMSPAWQAEIGIWASLIEIGLLIAAILVAIFGTKWFLTRRRIANEEIVATINRLIVDDYKNIRFQLLPLASGSVREAFPNRDIAKRVTNAFAKRHPGTTVVDLGEYAKAALSSMRNFISRSFAEALLSGDDLEEYVCAFVSEVHPDASVWRKVRPVVIKAAELRLFESVAFVARLKQIEGLVLDPTFLQRLDSIHVLALCFKSMGRVPDEKIIGRILLPKCKHGADIEELHGNI